MSTQKFRDLIHYVIWKCEDPSLLGSTKLNKIPWYVDTYAYRRDGASITGETYVKRQYGPVPKSILETLRTLGEEGKIFEREPRAEYQPKEFVALTAPDMSAFAERDLRLLDAVIQEICWNHTATSISGASHDQIWKAAALGETIPLYAVLAAEPAEVTEEDMDWADGVLAGYNPARADEHQAREAALA